MFGCLSMPLPLAHKARLALRWKDFLGGAVKQRSREDLLNGIQKGTLNSKLSAYRQLLVQHHDDAKVLAAMTKKLATDPSVDLFKVVRRIDKNGGPRLDWPEILRQRLIKCKSVNGHLWALWVEEDYGPDDIGVFSNVILNDPDKRVREKTMGYILQRHHGSTNPALFEL